MMSKDRAWRVCVQFFAVTLMIFSTVSSAWGVCGYNDLYQNLKNIYENFADTADHASSLGLPKTCKQHLEQINIHFDQVFCQLGLNHNLPASIQELNTILETFVLYVNTEDCPVKTEFQSSVSEIYSFKQLVNQCQNTL